MEGCGLVSEDDIAEACGALARAAGDYLCNVVRERGVTCSVCATSVEGYDLCWRCQRDKAPGLADVVAPLGYAIAGTESAALVRDYKHHPVLRVREERSAIIQRLLFLGIKLHERCIGAAAGRPVSLRLAIPSLTSRPGAHPLGEIVRSTKLVAPGVELTPAPDVLCDRAISADKFVLQPATRLGGDHVLVLDDSWTTGSTAQSAALALRRAGASAVSVMVVGRWLSPQFGSTAGFVKARLNADYDPLLCPVTGGRCP